MSVLPTQIRHVAVLVSALAIVATALLAAPSTGVASAADAAGDDALVAAVRAHLLSVDPDPDADQTPSLGTVADLNDDGVAERLQIVVEGTTTDEAVTTVFARDGLTGAVLFSDTFDGLLLNTLSSEDGLVLNTYDFGRGGVLGGVGTSHGDERPSGLSTYAVNFSQGVRVLSPTGEVTWTLDGPTTTYLYTGTTLAVTTEAITRAFALADVDGDDRDDLLLGAYMRTPGDGVVGPPQADEVTVTAVTADGVELVSHTHDISSVEGHIRNAGDLDEDGDDEVLLTVSTRTAEDDGAAVIIDPAADGGDPTMVEWPIGINGATTERVLDGGGLVFTRFDGGVTQLLDLTTGIVQTLTEPTTQVNYGWTSHGPIGDTDGDGNGDVAVTYREQFANEIYLTVIVHDTDGEVRRTEYSAPIAEATTAHRGDAEATGDLDGDGIIDIALAYGGDEDGDPVREHVVSGATGATLREGLIEGRLLSGSVDGQGQDHWTAEFIDARSDRITVRDGLTDEVLWSRVFHSQGEQSDQVFAASAGAGPIVEVSVWSSSNPTPPSAQLGILDENWVALHQVGADGVDLWRLGPDGPTPGVDDRVTLQPGEEQRYSQRVVVSAEQRNSCLDRADSDDAACHSILVTAAQAGVLSARIENQDNPAADLDIYVYEATDDLTRGEEIGRSAGFPGLDGTDPERIEIEVERGDYIVEFSYYLVPGSSFDEVIDLS